MIIGIDPGVNGGIAAMGTDSKLVRVRAFTGMSAEELVAEVGYCVQLSGSQPGITRCFVEKVGYMRGDGGKGAFTFGKVFGLLLGALYSVGARPQLVSPMMWQSYLGCLSGGNKNVTKHHAQKLFPHQKVTHAIADAMLIAEYGRIRGGGER